MTDQVHNRAVTKITMLPDGDHCVSLDLDARAFLWNLQAQPPEPQPWPERGETGQGRRAGRLPRRRLRR